MSLYLCVFQGDEDVDGVDLGRYLDFDAFRSEICKRLENGNAGSRFPILMRHADSDGAWEVDQLEALYSELIAIRKAFIAMPPLEYQAEWQRELAKYLGLSAESLRDSFIDVDGEPLVDRLIQLVQGARERKLAILFQ
jgi:hypothetical protein